MISIRQRAKDLLESEWFYLTKRAAFCWLVGMGLNMVAFCLLLIIIG